MIMDYLGQGLLNLWHAYRIPIILCALSVALIVRHRSRFNAPDALTDGLSLPSARTSKDRPVTDLPAATPNVQDEKGAQSLRNGSNASKVSSNRELPRRVTGTKPSTVKSATALKSSCQPEQLQPLVFFSSLSGSTEQIAKKFTHDLDEWRKSRTPTEITLVQLLEPQLLDLSYVDLDDYFTTLPDDAPRKSFFFVILIPSYDIDTIITNFLEHLKETHHDFRIDTAPLRRLSGYAVLGFGDEQGWPTDGGGFCKQAIETDKWMAKLTNKRRAYPLGLCDVNGDIEGTVRTWRNGVQETLSGWLNGSGLGEGLPDSGNAVESGEEEGFGSDEEADVPKKSKIRRRKQERIDDLEDLGRMINKDSMPKPDRGQSEPIAVDFTTAGRLKKVPDEVPVAAKEMVPKSSPTYAALTKQGYTIVGSHSGVKICRWTKSALRGRGSCYKYSFYGIQSHLCMEATPSLSCSNKCVFCWRHGTNPVSTTWRWQVDSPEDIFAGATAGHYRKIKSLKGVPGVLADRFAEAMTIRHCALSLVGEPIFYPHINSLVGILHSHHISTFLVCNAQHPDQLAALSPITQLYVSIDASNKESLRRIDRPLHRDFWSRFLKCLDILHARRHRQRTVFRLTLVKGFNVESEADGYAALVARALPAFIEVKGVTFCGTPASGSAGLTMENVPWHPEVCAFASALVSALARRGIDHYGLAAEHAHSCCVLIGDASRFKNADSGQWCTRIDYAKFFECVESGESFQPEDYVDWSGTPEWATFGNGGFDPRDTRWYRKNRRIKYMDKEGNVVDEGRASDQVAPVVDADADADGGAEGQGKK